MIVSDVPCYTVCMSKKLSDEEKHKNTLQRETPKKIELDHNCCQILAILREIPRDSGIKCNAEYLKERMGVAKITVYRATSILTDLGIIEFKHGSYVRIDDGKEYFDSDTKKNIALVAGVKGLMQQYKDTPVFNNLVELLYKLEPNLAKDDEIFSSARITVPPQIEYNVNPHNWNKVYEALKRNVKIKFRYKNHTQTSLPKGQCVPISFFWTTVPCICLLTAITQKWNCSTTLILWRISSLPTKNLHYPKILTLNSGAVAEGSEPIKA